MVRRPCATSAHGGKVRPISNSIAAPVASRDTARPALTARVMWPHHQRPDSPRTAPGCEGGGRVGVARTRARAAPGRRGLPAVVRVFALVSLLAGAASWTPRAGAAAPMPPPYPNPL